jgi:hypothetical protein
VWIVAKHIRYKNITNKLKGKMEGVQDTVELAGHYCN